MQSLLFNDYLARRMNDGLFRTVILGDAMAKWPAGGMFVAKDVAVEQARFDARETVTAGPMFGKKTYPTEGQAAEREAAVLSDNGMSPASFAGFGKLLLGTRRHNTDLPRRPDFRVGTGLAFGCHLRCRLAVTPTVLLREVMKTEIEEDSAAPEDASEDEQ